MRTPDTSGNPPPLKNAPWLSWTAPAIGLLFLVISLQFQCWKLGVRRYCSTGS